MLWSEYRDSQLFVFRNGELIYKRWDSTGRSVLLNPYGLPEELPREHANQTDLPAAG
jgi:hypothetical protein